MSRKYKTIDLCSGIGGIRRGFELTGRFENVLAGDNDVAACATYKHLYKQDSFGDITDEEFKKRIENTKYDVLLAGFPCQTFSSAGLRLGFKDTTKGTLFFELADIISRTRPLAIFLENVENLISHDRGRTIETIIRILEDELKYKVIGVTKEGDKFTYSRSTFVRNSKDFGLPQNRPRAFIMAFNKEEYGRALESLRDELPTKGSKVIAKDINAILEPQVDDVYYMASQYLETLKKHKEREKSKGNGFGYIVINEPGNERPYSNTIMATGGSGKERNLIYQPKEGVPNKVVVGKRSPLNSEGIRMMTPTEWGRLQGFIGYAFLDKNGRDHFSFPEGTTRGQQYKQFGNAVTIPVIEEMARFMLKVFVQLDNQRDNIVLQLARSGCSFEDACRGLGVSAEKTQLWLQSMNKRKKIQFLNDELITSYQRK